LAWAEAGTAAATAATTEFLRNDLRVSMCSGMSNSPDFVTNRKEPLHPSLNASLRNVRKMKKRQAG
jgi:hypothetical protein